VKRHNNGGADAEDRADFLFAIVGVRAAGFAARLSPTIGLRCGIHAIVGVCAAGFAARLSPTIGLRCGVIYHCTQIVLPLLVFVLLALQPGYHQQLVCVAAFMPLLAFVLLALQPGYHQQLVCVAAFMPLLVFVLLALQPGYHQQLVCVAALFAIVPKSLFGQKTQQRRRGCRRPIASVHSTVCPQPFCHCWCSCCWLCSQAITNNWFVLRR
jgi:hypothetical protein